MIEQSIRKRVKLKDDLWYSFTSGELELLLRRRGDELSEGFRHHSDESEFPSGFSEIPEGLHEGIEETHTWCRYLVGPEDELEFLA